MHKQEIKKTLLEFSLPKYNEIPDIGLYLDQVAKYINSYMKEFPEMNVTTSMISNYAKQKMIDRVNKKTYTRDQIATLLIITLCKSVLSIEHIKSLLTQLNPNYSSIEKYYSFFKESMEEAVISVFNRKSNPEQGLSQYEIILTSTATAIAHKMYLEKLFS